MTIEELVQALIRIRDSLAPPETDAADCYHGDVYYEPIDEPGPTTRRLILAG